MLLHVNNLHEKRIKESQKDEILQRALFVICTHVT